MSRFLYILAVLTAIAVIATWVALGSNKGWTKTLIATSKTDPVTEIEFTEYQKAFVPGVDFLGAGLGASVGLFGLGFVLSKVRSKKN